MNGRVGVIYRKARIGALGPTETPVGVIDLQDGRLRRVGTRHFYVAGGLVNPADITTADLGRLLGDKDQPGNLFAGDGIADNMHFKRWVSGR